MKIFRRLIIVFMFLFLAGCARTCEDIDRTFQAGDKNIIVNQYSCGKLIRTFKFKGMVNSSESSDGYYFTIGDTLYEISGDIQIFMAQ